MPLVLLVGQPLRDRRECARTLRDLARMGGYDVLVVDDAFLGCRPVDVVEAIATLRTRLRQTVVQYLTPARLVIVDHTNHTKSFRYELQRVAKEKHTRSCVVACTIGPPLSPEVYLKSGAQELTYAQYADVCNRFEPLLTSADQPCFNHNQLPKTLDFLFGGPKRSKTDETSMIASMAETVSMTVSTPNEAESSLSSSSSSSLDARTLTLGVVETVFAAQAAALSDAALRVRGGRRVRLPHRAVPIGTLHRLRHAFHREREEKEEKGKEEGKESKETIEDVISAFCTYLEDSLSSSSSLSSSLSIPDLITFRELCRRS